MQRRPIKQEWFEPPAELRETAMPLQQAMMKSALAAIPKRDPTGRPSLYRPEYDEVVEMLHMAGCQVQIICAIMAIDQTTYYEWARHHQSFSLAIMTGRELGVAMLAKSLYHRAMGYSHPAEHIHVGKEGEVTITPYIKHYPPDTQAAIYFLNNRGGGKWRSQQAVDMRVQSDDGSTQPTDPTRPPNITINAVRKDQT